MIDYTLQGDENRNLIMGILCVFLLPSVQEFSQKSQKHKHKLILSVFGI